MPDALINALSNLGGPGIVIAFIIWWTVRADKQREKEREQFLAEQRLKDEMRFNYDKERLEWDKALTGSLSALTNEVQNLKRR